MDPCLVDKRFGQLSTLGRDDVYLLHLSYGDQVREHPECADTDRYVQLYQALDRTGQGPYAIEVLGHAYFSSLRMQVRHAGNLMFLRGLWKQSVHDKKAVLAQIAENQAEPPPQPGDKDWQDVECMKDLYQCNDEFAVIRPQFYLHLKRYLNKSLYAKYYNGPNVNVTVWVIDAMAIAAWHKDPKILLDIMDLFIETRKLKITRQPEGERANMLIVLRDLLRATFDATEKKEAFIHLSGKVVSQYLGAEGGTLPGIDLGVGAYLRFINEIPEAALPDVALMKQLTKMADLKHLAQEVEQKVLSRLKAAGRKK